MVIIKMKACVLHQVNDLKYEEVQKPVRKKGEVLLQIKASGICGSDIQRVFEKGTYHFPTIPGHEFAGEIVEADDSSLIGKKVAVFPLIPCRECHACELGEYAQCSNYNYFGSRCDGGFAEYLNVPLWNLVFVPDEVSYEEAAMCEPSAVAFHALNQSDLKVGEKIAIFGAGAIGLIIAQWAKTAGASQVILIDIDESKLQFAKSLGYADIVNSSNIDVVEEIKRLTNGKMVDVSIEGAGVSISLAQSLKITKAFGRVVLMGNPIKEMNIDQKAYWEILRKQLVLKGTWNSSYNGMKNDWEQAISAMASKKLQLKPLITNRFDFKDCNKAFDIMKDKSEFFVKVMFINGGNE